MKEFRDVSTSGFDFVDLAYSLAGARLATFFRENCLKTFLYNSRTPITDSLSLELEQFTRLKKGLKPTRDQLEDFEMKMKDILQEWKHRVLGF